jgi:hypothetical protein
MRGSRPGPCRARQDQPIPPVAEVVSAAFSRHAQRLARVTAGSTVISDVFRALRPVAEEAELLDDGVRLSGRIWIPLQRETQRIRLPEPARLGVLRPADASAVHFFINTAA